MTRVEEIRHHREEAARLRAELRFHTEALNHGLYQVIMEAYIANPSAHAIADEFGVSYATVAAYRKRWRSEGKDAPRSKNRRLQPPKDRSDIIDDFIRTGNLTETGKHFGVTGERVRQIVKRHEMATGRSLGRPGKGTTRKERVTWQCEHCGKVHVQTPLAAARRRCGACVYFRSRNSRFGDPILLEQWIAARKAGATWASLAAAAGIKHNAQHLVPRAIWMYLRREHRHDEVPAIWRGDKVGYLEKRWPMRESDPIVRTSTREALAGVAQSVEQGVCNAQVGGSIPARQHQFAADQQ